MAESTGARDTLYRWTAIGTGLQLAMVLSGHWVVAVAELFGILGTLIALAIGLLYASAARISFANAAVGGAVAGGVSALLGALVSWLLGDVSLSIPLVALASGLVAGAIGGLVGHAVASRSRGAA